MEEGLTAMAVKVFETTFDGLVGTVGYRSIVMSQTRGRPKEKDEGHTKDLDTRPRRRQTASGP